MDELEGGRSRTGDAGILFDTVSASAWIPESWTMASISEYEGWPARCDCLEWTKTAATEERAAGDGTDSHVVRQPARIDRWALE